MRRQREEIRELLESLVSMADEAVESLHQAIDAFMSKDPHAQVDINRRDERIDAMENANDARCLRIFALYKPEADDLRTVVMALKIINDLERIGDHAINIAERAAELAAVPDTQILPQFQRLGAHARGMVNDAVTAFIARDSTLAKAIIHRDHEVDRLFREVVSSTIVDDPEHNLPREAVIAMVFCAKELERVADLATNLAEDVIFIADGVQVRHELEKKGNKAFGAGPNEVPSG